MIQVDIIIPVYRGIAQTCACIESVLAARNAQAAEIIVINDASPEPGIGIYLEMLEDRGSITLITNASNLGFVATCNHAMQMHADRDVVLLNSDTLVGDGWLDRLAACAAVAPLAASVTPFSNNATICSYPRIAVANDLPPSESVATLDEMFSRVNARRFAEIPTAVGFCMYMARTAIQAVGLFDTKAFGRGYGEENDWCMRASECGFTHLLCGDVFIYHQGEVSFGAESLSGKKQAQSVIDARYPKYGDLISKHLAEDPARVLRRRVDIARLAGSLRPRILFITHNWGGGTERHVNDLASLLADDLEILVLQPKDEQSLSVRWLRDGEEFEAFFDDRKDAQPLLDLLRAIGVSRVHLHHVHGLPAYVLGLHTSLGVPLDVTLHDYFPLTQRYHLGFGGRLEADEPLPGNDWGLTQEEWRNRMGSFLESAARIIAPSHDLARRLLDAFPNVDVKVLGHPESSPVPIRKAYKVLVLGGLTVEKGLKVVEACALDADARKLPLFFKLIGHTAESVATYPELPFVVGGTYRDDDLGQLIELERADAFLFPAQIPESYSYTLSTAILAHLPIVASELGAFTERLKTVTQARTLPWNSTAQTWNDALLAAIDTQRLCEPKSSSAENPGLTGPAYASWYMEEIAKTRPVTSDHADFPVRYWYQPRFQGLRKEYSLQQLFNVGVDCGHAPSRAELRRRTGIADWQIADASRRLASAEHELSEAHRSISLSDERLADERRQVDALNAELEQRRAQFMEMRDTFETERDATLRAYADIVNSTSWRLTAPLRSFVQWARGKRSAFTEFGVIGRRLRRDVSMAGQILMADGAGALSARIRQRFSSRGMPPAATSEAYEVTPEIGALAIAHSENPTYSLVIPVFGQHLLTFNCLHSIAETCNALAIEVIVIDDCSPVAASEVLSQISGISIVRNETNIGFLRSCNHGATLAKGQYIVILNNDLILTGEWLQSMAAVYEQFPDTGLVGAKLIYPDGRLQEAGGIVWRDGSAWNVGRGDDPAKPEYNFVREVDYCSGACLLIKRELWNTLGGFDEAYAPAYYEDTDLAFRVREAGKRVFYQPHAVVVHFEGQSSGIDVTKGIKRHQLINQTTFAKRWETVLQSHRVNGSSPLLESNRYTSTKILVIDACMLTPDQDAGSLRMFEMLNLMRVLGHKVTFVAANLEYALPYVTNIQSMGVEVLHHPHIVSIARHLERHGAEYDIVMLSRESVATPYLDVVKMHASQAKVIFDTVDLHFLRAERQAVLTGGSLLRNAARAMRERELKLINTADITLVVSPIERDLLQQLAPQANVQIVSIIHVPMPGQKSFAERDGILFIGGFRHPPNLDAVTWYVENVLPLLRKKSKGLVTTLIGSNAPPTLQQFAAPDFVIAGFVPDVTPHYEAARLSISPLRYGAGVKGKVNLAMQYGVPVVATTISVEGMYLIDGDNVLVADEPEAFADAIIRLHTDVVLWNRLRLGGLENIEQNFSRDTARRALKSVLVSRLDCTSAG